MADIIRYKISEELDKARTNAQKEQGESAGATMFPVMIFKQGIRTFISTVFTVIYIVTDLKSKPTNKDKGLFDAKTSMNRPLDTNHAKNTKEYIKRNFKTKYILPAMTLNIQEPINIYTTDYTSSVKQGFMVIPYGIKLSITDGQHRRKALEDLWNELPEDEFNLIKNDGIPVMITVESEIAQIHQDFADCSKTKELPKSLIAVYDKRNPANSFVIDLIDNCPLFKDKVDATSNTLSKKSTRILLVSQVRSAIKELLFASSAYGDVDLERRAIEMYENADSVKYKKDIAKFIDFINKATLNIPILKQVSEMKDAIHMAKIPVLRSEYLILNSAGLNILCRIGHYILEDETHRSKIDTYVTKLGKIDWRKSAEIWRGDGNIVTQGEKALKITTSNSSMKMAIQKVKNIIGME